eukprot:CAMPEP_0185028322 /NCGR_PEP_ID=MMETSP1103-20130426/13960_1 /TAXON_ID=36769 /ORGANISM="Paraphysomonas bandaiensis, Strain Caron Lab Isolate" /LENGTH=489 /DNA_ID=CAMNT_0027562703 /DNA_START=294 /DNA_END=1763 /DNA_ORIENTATION=-
MVSDTPPKPRAYMLLITGCGILSPENSSFESLLMSGGTGGERSKIWDDISFTKHNFKWGIDEVAIQKIITDLRCGIYMGAIICDLSCMSTQEHVRIFQDKLEPTLRAYVHMGGYVAFPTFELGMIVENVNQMFGSDWRSGGFYSAPCHPCAENMETFSSIFPGHEKMEYCPKANYIRNVPFVERCMVVNVTDCSSSICDPDEANDDVVVAVHRKGPNGGMIAVFGDVNFEPETCRLVHDFVMGRAALGPAPAAFDSDFEEQLMNSQRRGICGWCIRPNATVGCKCCRRATYCDGRCRDLASPVHRLICGRRIDMIEREWRIMPYSHRQGLQLYPGYLDADVASLLERCRRRAEHAFDAITANDVDTLNVCLEMIDANTTAEEAGLADVGGLPVGTTLLAYAAQQDNKVHLMSTLLHRGANPNLVDARGQSVFESLRDVWRLQVRLSGIQAAVQLLKSFGYRLRRGEKWEDFSSVAYPQSSGYIPSYASH